MADAALVSTLPSSIVIGTLTATRALLGTIVVGLVALGGTQARARAEVVPQLLAGDFGSFAVRPPAIELSGDGTATVGGHGWRAPDAFTGKPGTSGRPTSYGSIQWSVYDASHAVGTGTMWLDNGIPDDAGGTFYRYAARIEAVEWTRFDGQLIAFVV
jgi:hypothetical protein